MAEPKPSVSAVDDVRDELRRFAVANLHPDHEMVDAVVQRFDDMVVEVRRDALAWTDNDRELPEDEAIHDTHPVRDGSGKIYLEAMRMVGAKRSKGGLVDLVNWLLHRISEEEDTTEILQHVLGVAADGLERAKAGGDSCADIVNQTLERLPGEVPRFTAVRDRLRKEAE